MPVIYQSLLRLYPAEHRREFGEEMAAVFSEIWAETESKGPLACSLFWTREVAGLVKGAFHEHLRLVPGVNGVSLSTRRFTMRNGFRFPKTTIVFMALILGGVLVAIKKGQDIATSVPDINPPLQVHIQPVHSILLGGMPLFFAIFYAAGLIGWAILFALKRSGTHRLADVSGDQH